MTAEKLRVLVRVDLDCTKAQVSAQGHVTSKSVHGLYGVMKCANSLTAGMSLELDMTRPGSNLTRWKNSEPAGGPTICRPMSIRSSPTTS